MCAAFAAARCLHSGSSGGQVAQKAAAFGMTILAYDPYVDPATVPENVRLVHLDELIASADAVTLHCVATPQRRAYSTRRRSRR